MWINLFSWGIAVAIFKALGQLSYLLHSPAGAVAFIGVIYKANLNFVWSPILFSSLVLVIFNRILNKKNNISSTLDI